MFDHTDYNKKCNKLYGILYYLTFKKMENLKKRGYFIKYIWESDWNKFKSGADKSPNIQNYGFDK